LSPSLFGAGAKQRGAALETFIAHFWMCRKATVAKYRRGAGPSAVGAVAGAALSDSKTVDMSIAEMYALHPVLPAVVESSIRSEFDDDMFHRFFAAMLADARINTEVPMDEVSHLRKDAATVVVDKPNTFAYVGNVCRTKKELFDYMGGSAAVIGDFMVPLLIPFPVRH
jgi:hypothetical protein